MAGGKRSKVKIGTAKRRERSLELRLEGYSMRAIATQMKTEGFRTGLATVCRDVAYCLDEIRLDYRKDAANLMKIELERLEIAQQAASSGLDKATPASLPQAIAAYVKVCESRRKLLGLDAPVQLQIEQGVEQQVAERDELLITMLEQVLDAESFSKVVTAAERLCEARSSADSN